MMASSTGVDEYTRSFDRWITGPLAVRQELRAELEGHLDEARSAGRLDEAIERLGSPRDAARTFVQGRSMRPLPRWRRLLGAGVDFATLALIISVGGRIAETVSPALEVGSFLGVVVSIRCPDNECVPGALLAGLAVLGALFYYSVLLTLLEWRYARTPGKIVAGARVVSEDGIAISLGQAVLRRLPLVFSGVLQVVDWAFALFGPSHQRAFDRLAKTIVVDDR